MSGSRRFWVGTVGFVCAGGNADQVMPTQGQSATSGTYTRPCLREINSLLLPRIGESVQHRGRESWK